MEQPVVTNLSKVFPHVDKVCDAVFLKKVTGITTKKDSVRFILGHPDCKKFFSSLESEMVQTDLDAQGKIAKYFTTIPEEIKKFKMSQKDIKDQEAENRKEAAREALKAEIRREMEMDQLKKNEQALARKELEMPVEILTPVTPINIPVPKSTITPTRNASEPPKETSLPTTVLAPECLQESPSPTESTLDAHEMDLDQFYKFLKGAIELNLLEIKDARGNLVTISKVEYDHQKICVIVKNPIITPKISL